MIVEILDRRAVVRHRVRLRAYPATLGRGYQNEVILDDRFIDPVHARLEWDGAGSLVLVDQQSVNGIVDAATGTRVSRLPIRSGTEVRLGRTTLRFVDPSEPVEPALVETSGAGWAIVGESRLLDLAIAGGAGLLLAFDNYVDASDRVRISGLFGEALTSLLVVAAWAGAWAFVNRITQHRFRFRDHFVIPCLAIIVFTASNAAASYLRFLFPGSVDWEFGAAIIAAFVGVAALAAHLGRVSLMSRGHRWLWSAGVVGLLAIVAGLSEHGDKPEFTSSRERTPLKPLGSALIPGVSPAQFLVQMDSLKGEVDRLTERMAKRDESREE
jgi:pSer/pThr/pTyr-binding forkhead associated (FHA) protein